MYKRQVDAKTASAHLEKQAEDAKVDEEQEGKTKNGQGAIVKASEMDTMLHGDSRFWEVIANRREQHVKQTAQNGTNDKMAGPTVGRRRGDDPSNAASNNNAITTAGSPAKATEPLFSIGNELDFLPGSVEPEASPSKSTAGAQSDFLMDALNALDDGEDVETEEVVFETPATTPPVAATPLMAAPPEVVSPPPPTTTTTTPTGASSNTETKTDTLVDLLDTTATTPTPPTKADPEPEAQPTKEATMDDTIDDMDALLAAADEDLEDFGDLDLGDLDDDDDADLDDLEAMLAM